MSTSNFGEPINNNYWYNGMSSIATEGDSNLNFANNWNNYNNANYNSSNPDSQLSLELAQMSEFIQGNNPAAAILFFIQDFSQISMSQSQDGINEMSDQEEDLANVANAESQIKSLFTNVESNNNNDLLDTVGFLSGIKEISFHLKSDLWLSGLNSSVKSSLSQMTSIVNMETLGMIWQQANPYQDILTQQNASNYGTYYIQSVTNGNTQGFVDKTTYTNINPEFWYFYVKSQNLNITKDHGSLSTVAKIASIPGTQSVPEFNVYADLNYNPADQTLTISFDAQNLNISNGTAFGEAISLYNSFATGLGQNGFSVNGVNLFQSLDLEAGSYDTTINSIEKPQNNILQPQMQSLQTMLTGFDTLNSATSTLTNQYQSQAQYEAGEYQEKGSFVADIQGDVVQANNSINSNIQPAA